MEYLGLVRADGSVPHEYAPSFPPQTANVAHGVDANGADRSLSAPTPGAANPLGDQLDAGAVTASPARGFYTLP